MKIESVQAIFPKKRVANDFILNLIREQSKSHYKGDLEVDISKIGSVLKMTGAEYRHMLDKEENAMPLIREAFHRALDESGWKKNDIDLLIYVGVGRGFLEPGGSYITAQALGLRNVHCFDVVDACMSWLRATYIVSHFLASQAYKKVVIINAEFNWRLYGFPEILKLTGREQLEWTFPAFTIGEAATVTLLSNAEAPWKFHFSSHPELADLCTIPSKGYEIYTDYPSERLAKNGPNRFTSYGKELHKTGFTYAIEVAQQLKIPPEEIDIVFTHASSKREWDNMGKALKWDDKIYHIFQETGNIVSASVPAAIALAQAGGRLKRGDRVVCWVGSAGMSFGVASFVF